MQLSLLVQQGVHFVVFERFGKSITDLIEAGNQREGCCDTFLDVAAHCLGGVKLRLLLQVPDAQARFHRDLAIEIAIDPRHDAQQTRFARAIEAEHADFRAMEKVKRYVLQDHTLGRHDLADPAHRVDVLSHVFSQRAVVCQGS